MSKPNRELLVLFNQNILSPQAIEHEVEQLHNLLGVIERLENIIKAYEIININSYKIINKPLQLRTFFKERNHKPFVF